MAKRINGKQVPCGAGSWPLGSTHGWRARALRWLTSRLRRTYHVRNTYYGAMYVRDSAAIILHVLSMWATACRAPSCIRPRHVPAPPAPHRHSHASRGLLIDLLTMAQEADVPADSGGATAPCSEDYIQTASQCYGASFSDFSFGMKNPILSGLDFHVDHLHVLM